MHGTVLQASSEGKPSLEAYPEFSMQNEQMHCSTADGSAALRCSAVLSELCVPDPIKSQADQQWS